MVKISTNVKSDIQEQVVNFTIQEDLENFALIVNFEFEASPDDFVLLPACAYNGNRFEVLKKAYPPMFELHEAKVDMPITITDVPRLEKDGSGCIEVTTGDLATPCVGIFNKKNKKGLLLFTTQGIDKNFGLSYETGKISISYPHLRKKKMYRSPFLVDSTDKGIDFKKGEIYQIPYKLLEFECDNVKKLYRVFFENRKIMGMDCAHSAMPNWQNIWNIHEEKYNKKNWSEALGAYCVGDRSSLYQTWQPGWVGGAMSSYALLKLGNSLTKERAVKTLDFLFSTQTNAGFFESCVDEERKIKGDGFKVKGSERWHLIRKSADVLYFLFKHFALMPQVPKEYISATKRLADGFVALWDKYGEFGHFVNLDTGEIVAGGSTAAGIAPAALVSSYRFFGDEKYLDVAKKSAEMMHKRDVENGYTTGGPGEILQCPDSESAFGILESFVELYDLTKEDKYLEMAKEAAHLCSSWVVSYNYKFPENSEFARLQMKTIGSVFANLQNKHSAPGICTLSGNSLLKLYDFTGDILYKHLIDDISRNIWQYMSTDERPIYSWGNEKLPQGVICERVNMSDWEDYRCIGGVFNGSCWSEAANMITIAEIEII